MSGKHLSVQVHFTWSTARREPWLNPEWHQPMYRYIGGILRKQKAKLLAAGGVYDHIHLYASLPSTMCVAKFVNIVKSNSSRWVHEHYPKARGFEWQDGYGAFSVSKSEELRVMRYIANQERHHRKRTFKEEFVALLIKHGVEYDLKYLWD